MREWNYVHWLDRLVRDRGRTTGKKGNGNDGVGVGTGGRGCGECDASVWVRMYV